MSGADDYTRRPINKAKRDPADLVRHREPFSASPNGDNITVRVPYPAYGAANEDTGRARVTMRQPMPDREADT
jgi:hypothetical protein